MRHPNLTVLDWNGYTYGQPPADAAHGSRADDIHMTRAVGATALANFLKAAIDACDVRAVHGRERHGRRADSTHRRRPHPTGHDHRLSAAHARSRARHRATATSAEATASVGAGRTVTIDLDAALPADAPAVALSVTAVEPVPLGLPHGVTRAARARTRRT